MEIALQVISLFGGLGMFLFGMHIMSTGWRRPPATRCAGLWKR